MYHDEYLPNSVDLVRNNYDDDNNNEDRT